MILFLVRGVFDTLFMLSTMLFTLKFVKLALKLLPFGAFPLSLLL